MYPNNPYSSDNDNRYEPYSPLAPQQRTPDENGSYHFTPDPTDPDSEKKNRQKKRTGERKVARTVATAAAVVLISAGVGGGSALYVLNNAELPQQADDQSGTMLQTSTVDQKPVVTDGSVTSVAEIAADTVVEIDTKTRQQNFFTGTTLVPGAGSGVIISEDGYIVTNDHVVRNTESVVVRLRDGTEYEAEVIGIDSETDLAVIKVGADNLPAATFADSDQIQVGDLAVAIGNPLGELGGTVTSGIISATGREVTVDSNTMTLLQTSAAVNPGNSGGGLFDANGHLIGVVNAKSQGVDIEGLGFAIPSNTVQKVVADIIDNGYVSGRPEMGITVIAVTDALTAQYVGVNKYGIYVTDPGLNEGLREGDRFVFIDGESVDSSSDISAVLKRHNVGDTISVTVEREGKAIETQVTLRERTPASEQQQEVPVQDPDDI